MKRFILLLFLMLAPFLSSPSIRAGELFVNPEPPDCSYFKTIQSALDMAKPGDVITIAGGTYFEHLEIKQSGTPEAPILIRPLGNQPVVINAGAPLSLEWKPAPESPGTYRASLPAGTISAEASLWEMPARVKLARVSSADQVNRRLGSWFYDKETGSLSLRTTGPHSATEATFWLQAAEKPGIRITASHIQLSRLHVTLGLHGILLDPTSSHVTIDSCRLFCNSLAGIHVSGTHHLITDNKAFLNNTYGIQLRHKMEHITIRHNQTYHNGPHNGELSGNSVSTDLGIYGVGSHNLFEGNIVDGLFEDAFRNKHSESPTNLFRGNLVRGSFTTGALGVYRNTFLSSGLGMRPGMFRDGGPDAPERSWEKVDSSGRLRKVNLIHPVADQEAPLFADPAYRDFRLLPESPGRLKGAFAEDYPIAYVDPANGSDSHSGNTPSQAFASTEYALQNLSAGGTLYLLPGHYNAPVLLRYGGLHPKAPLRIRAYGGQNGRVILNAGMAIENAPFIEIDNLDFANSTLKITHSDSIVVQNTTFSGIESGLECLHSRHLTVDRCSFSENKTALSLWDSPEATIVQSLFLKNTLAIQTDKASASGFNCDYNAFSPFSLDLAPYSFTSLSQWLKFSPQARYNTEASFSSVKNAVQTVAIRAGGIDFGHIGSQPPSAARQLELHNLHVGGLTPHSATLLWDNTVAAQFEVELFDAEGKSLRHETPPLIFQVFAESFDLRRPTEALHSTQRYASLGRLSPGSTYKAVVVQLDATGQRSHPASIEFTTPQAYSKPATRYLSPDGNDQADGATPATSWRTLAHAMPQLKPGDELILRPGVYREVIRPLISGTKERPITIRGETGAVLDLEETLPVAVEILNTDYIILNNITIRGGIFPHSLACLVSKARGIVIERCRLDYPRGSDFINLKLGYFAGVLAHQAPDIRLVDNLFLCATTAVSLSHSPGATIEHNTIIGEGNYGIVLISSSAEEEYIIRRNLFYRATLGYKVNPCLWIFGIPPRLESDENLYFIPETSKAHIGRLPGMEGVMLGEWRSLTGCDKASLQAEPLFSAPEKGDFSLRPESPGYHPTAPHGARH